MKPLVSVIVPVYNVEEYLPRCLDSLCRQSLKNIEILLVDDASPDRCGKICDIYAAKDARFKVIHLKTNQGLSVARNIGIKHAISDYLMFVDSDDWVHEDFCKAPYECTLKYNADLVMFRRLRTKECKFSSSYKSKNLLPSAYKTRLEAMDLLLTSIIGTAAWNKLYHKKLFSTISFPPGYYFEDAGTIYKTIWHANHIYYLDIVLYFWYIRNGSISTLKGEKYLQDWIEMHEQRYHDLSGWGYPKDKLEGLLQSTALYYCILKKPDNLNNRYVFYAKTLRTAKTMPDSFSRKLKVLFFLFKYCPPLFELICSLWNKKKC